MADQINPTTRIINNTLSNGMNKDLDSLIVPEGTYTHARNAVNNSHSGQMVGLMTEPSNLNCLNLPYTIIGCIPLDNNEWAIFSTDNSNSEIGIFNESTTEYYKVVNDPCLNFNTNNLITGAFRSTYNCSRRIYWDDGLNPSRFLDLNDIPFRYTTINKDGCIIKNYTNRLDCEKLRIVPHVSIPKLELSKSKSSGTLPNGTYQVAVAYTINQIKVTDYVMLSNLQTLFNHNGVGGALELSISNADTESFDEFELVIIYTSNGQTVAKRLGVYSTFQNVVYIESIDPTLPTVPLSAILLRSPAYEKSDAMYNVNNYLLRVGVYTKPHFNYQPQANKIEARWVSVRYPADYYKRGGNKVGYMRDENYVFFIRWVYNTGERSASYVIPGRAPMDRDMDILDGVDTKIENESDLVPYRWRVENTATLESIEEELLDDGGVKIAEGKMGYYESTEIYPNDKPNIWGELCGKPIRLHKFPDNSLAPQTNHFTDGGEYIIVMGVKFLNITHPLDNDGNPIESIVGYEILRGTRDGHKSIIAKGLINNMRGYEIPNNGTVKGLYANYPYNDLSPDEFLTKSDKIIREGVKNNQEDKTEPLDIYYKDILSFHSPETNFYKPFLSVDELKVYGDVFGMSEGIFEKVYKHPKFKLISRTVDLISDVLYIGNNLQSFFGNKVASDLLTFTGTENLPARINMTPKERNTLVGALVGGVVGIWSEGLGNAVADIIDGIAVSFDNSIDAAIAIAKVITKEQIVNVVYGLIPSVQYAWQYNSHGFYNAYLSSEVHRYKLKDASYISSTIQNFGKNYRVNNLFRPNYVIINTEDEVQDPYIIDNSRKLPSNIPRLLFTPIELVKKTGIVYGPRSYYGMTSSYPGSELLIRETRELIESRYLKNNAVISGRYGALKVNLRAQYGQLDSVKQIPISSEIFRTYPIVFQKYKTGILFGGDIYINRYTEKNTFFFFHDWLFDQPDEYEYDYRTAINIPYPRYWIDSNKIRFSDLQNMGKYRHLHALIEDGYYIKQGMFFISYNGVRDFFVESEINLAHRDWEEEDSKRHYDPYEFTDISTLFRSDVIKSNNYFKYDDSLSVSKTFNSYISWGEMLPRDFDPYISETCYRYYPKRILYSLPQELENKKDNWRNFLANNYKDMPGTITSIKPISKTGALIMMKDESPKMFLGVDQLQTDAGIKVTIGDGGLFNQPLQNIINTDANYKYGACQNKYSVTSTPYGIFYISQAQGKIFNYTDSLDDITRYGMKWWFSRYLPSELLKVFPDYKLYDNPVEGIGCQVLYDSTNEMLYFTKKDYKPLHPDLKLDPETNRFYFSHGYYTTKIPGRKYYTCPPGYTRDDSSGYCSKWLTTNPTMVETTKVVPVKSSTWKGFGKDGMKLYHRINGDGTGLSYDDPFGCFDGICWEDFKDNPFWKGWGNLTDSAPEYQGPANRISIWIDDGKSNYLSQPRDYLNKWFGYDVPINVTADKTLYHVAIFSISGFRIKVDGVTKIESIGDRFELQFESPADDLSNFLRIYPVPLGKGEHVIRVEGLCQGPKAGFGAEIYQNTASEILFAQSYDDLNVVFTTRDKSLVTIPSETPTCPEGYELDYTPSGYPYCKIKVQSGLEEIVVPEKTVTHELKEYVELTDSRYFEDVSWTISYDPKIKKWISFHDWKPDLVLPAQNHFMTIKKGSIWKHNQCWNSFCNFYGVDYPFDIEIPVTTMVESTLRSVEYILEAYRYKDNGQDKQHLIDHNFDKAIVYNSEQISGLLRLHPTPKNDPASLLEYPKISKRFNAIDILYSNEENKYRFNQFFDITKQRGEFMTSRQAMFITKGNGYEFTINPKYINYIKAPVEHKKFRHNNIRIFLRKTKPGDVQLTFKLFNAKTQISPR